MVLLALLILLDPFNHAFEFQHYYCGTSSKSQPSDIDLARMCDSHYHETVSGRGHGHGAASIIVCLSVQRDTHGVCGVIYMEQPNELFM